MHTKKKKKKKEQKIQKKWKPQKSKQPVRKNEKWKEELIYLNDYLNASRRNHSVIGLSLQIVQTYMQWQTNKISAEARNPTNFFFTISGS
jgi:hypothetical protein